MALIIVQGTDTTKTMQRISIEAHVWFSEEMYKNRTALSKRKLKELQEELEVVMEKYFPAQQYESDSWLTRKK